MRVDGQIVGVTLSLHSYRCANRAKVRRFSEHQVGEAADGREDNSPNGQDSECGTGEDFEIIGREHRIVSFHH